MLFLISILAAFGLAVALVEKGDDFPANIVVKPLRKFLEKYVNSINGVFDCTVCMSFWTSLIIDVFLFIIYGHFFWPISGFATLGVTWLIIEYLNLLDKS